MAKDCLILPSSGVDLGSIVKLAETAVTLGISNKSLADFQFCLGLVEYRQGNFVSAVDWVRKSLDHPLDPADSNRELEAYMVLAMAHHQLGHRDEARVAFANGVEIAETKLPRLDSGDLGEDWPDWIIAHTLLDEAKTRINRQPGTNKE